MFVIAKCILEKNLCCSLGWVHLLITKKIVMVVSVVETHFQPRNIVATHFQPVILYSQSIKGRNDVMIHQVLSPKVLVVACNEIDIHVIQIGKRNASANSMT